MQMQQKRIPCSISKAPLSFSKLINQNLDRIKCLIITMDNNHYVAMIPDLTLSHKLKCAMYVFFCVLAFRLHENGSGFCGYQSAGSLGWGDFRKCQLLVYVFTEEKVLRYYKNQFPRSQRSRSFWSAKGSWPLGTRLYKNIIKTELLPLRMLCKGCSHAVWKRFKYATFECAFFLKKRN